MADVSAVNPEQFQQLPMFVPAGRLRDVGDNDAAAHFNGGESDFDDVYPYDTWERKRQEANGPDTADRGHGGARHNTPQPGSMTEHVAAHGVREPVVLHHYGSDPGEEHKPVMMDGYHRTAAAHAVNPATEVPVQHTDGSNWSVLRKGRY